MSSRYAEGFPQGHRMRWRNIIVGRHNTSLSSPSRPCFGFYPEIDRKFLKKIKEEFDIGYGSCYAIKPPDLKMSVYVLQFPLILKRSSCPFYGTNLATSFKLDIVDSRLSASLPFSLSLSVCKPY